MKTLLKRVALGLLVASACASWAAAQNKPVLASGGVVPLHAAAYADANGNGVQVDETHGLPVWCILGCGGGGGGGGDATAANQVLANTKLDTLHADLTAPTPPGTNIVGDVGSASFSATCSVLTLPGTGGTFATGDLVANSATAGSVAPLTCSLARYSGGPVTITKAQIVTSTTGLANASFRGHVYTAAPTVTNGNDGAFLSTQSGHFCRLDVTVDQAFSNGANGSGAPITGSTCTRVLSATQTVYVLVEARAAYAWTAGQTLTVTLEGVN